MKKTFISKMRNFSSSDVLCSIEPLPEWLSLEIKKSSLEDFPSTSSLSNFDGKFDLVVPDERVMTNYDLQNHNSERFIFFPVEARTVYMFTFQISLAGKVPENLTASVKHNLLLRFFSQTADHLTGREANSAMTSLSFTTYTNFQMEIQFVIDNKSMLEVAVTAPTVLTPISRTTNPSASQLLASAALGNLKSFALFNRLECFFNEYFVVPAPTRLDFNSMNMLMDKFQELPVLVEEDELHRRQHISKLPPEITKKFYLLNQNYTFWLKNNTKEKIEVTVEFIAEDLMSEDISISLKVEDNNSGSAGIGAGSSNVGSSEFPSTPLVSADLASHHQATHHPSNPPFLGSMMPSGVTGKRIVLNIGESVSLTVKITTKPTARWDEAKIANFQQLFPINNELISLDSKLENQFGDSIQEEYERKHCNSLQALIYRLRKFRIGPCRFGTIRFITTPFNKPMPISPSPSIGSELYASEKSNFGAPAVTVSSSFLTSDETKELLDIELKGALAFGSTLYLLPAHRFCPVSTSSSFAFQGSHPHALPPHPTATHEEHLPPLPPLAPSIADPSAGGYLHHHHHEHHLDANPVIMYQDKKGYWNLSFPGVKKINRKEDSLPSSPSSFQQPNYHFELAKKEYHFYLINSSNETLHFCTSNYTVRYPGLFLQVKEKMRLVKPSDKAEDGVAADSKEEEFTYYCDTIHAVMEPNEGFVPPNSSLLVKILLRPACSSDSITYDQEELTNKYFREEYQRLLISFQHHHGDLSSQSHPAPVPPASHSTGPSVHSVLNHFHEHFQVNNALLFTIPFYIWDKNWLLHPPISLHINITSNEDIPMISSSPISHTNRSKQSMDLIHLNKQSSSSNLDITPSALPAAKTIGGIATLPSPHSLVRMNSLAVDSHGGLLDEREIFAESVVGEPLSKHPSTDETVVPSNVVPKVSPEILNEIATLLAEYNESACRPSNLLLSCEDRNALISPMLVNLNESNDEEDLQGLKLVGGDEPVAKSTKNRSILNIRGITPYVTPPLPSSPLFSSPSPASTSSSIRFGVIDLGKQSIKTDRIEWLLTIENQSKHHVLKYQIDDFSVQALAPLAATSALELTRARSVSGETAAQPSLPWLILGRNAGLIPPLHSTSIMLYYDRSVPGKYLSYIRVHGTSIPIGALFAGSSTKKTKQPALTPEASTKSESFYIKSMFEVVPNEKYRRPSIPSKESGDSLVTAGSSNRSRDISEAIPLVRELSGNTWRALHQKWFQQFFLVAVENRSITEDELLAASNSYFLPIAGGSANSDGLLSMNRILLKRESGAAIVSALVTVTNLSGFEMELSLQLSNLLFPGTKLSLRLEDNDREIVSEEDASSLVLRLSNDSPKRSVLVQLDLAALPAPVLETLAPVGDLPVQPFFPLGELQCRLPWMMDTIETSLSVFLFSAPR